MPVERKLPIKVSQKDVKLCELCGTLNLEHNKECWTCRWRGSFSRDERTVELAWQRLETQYEEVRMEHVTARRNSPLGDFGAARSASLPQKAFAALAAGWRRFLDQRDLRASRHQARRQQPQMPTPPDQLSI